MSKPCNLVVHPRAVSPLALSLCGGGTGSGRAQPQVWVLCGRVRVGTDQGGFGSGAGNCTREGGTLAWMFFLAQALSFKTT